MIFVADKYHLSYYSNIPPELCYCENVATASDMYLQGFWGANQAPYTFSVEVWSVDGNTIYEVIDPKYYKIYVGVDPFSGRHYLAFNLKSFSPQMCAQKCFLMKIGVKNASGVFVFANYTERYCLASCCEYASAI